MADKDIREDFRGPDEVPPSERPRSEGGPATRDPEWPLAGESLQPAAVADALSDVPHSEAASEPAVPVVPLDVASAVTEEIEPAADAPGQPEEAGVAVSPVEPEAVSDPSDLLAARASALEHPVVAPESGAPEMAEYPSELAADDRTGTADSWRSAIADALAEPPSETEPGAGATSDEVPAADPSVEAAGSPEPERATPPTDSSFTSAAEDLFRPPAIAEDPHLITLGRRLNPSLSIPRPVLPDIAPSAEPSVAVQEPWWKTTPWGSHLWTAGRYAAYIIGGYLALVLVLVIVFRFINPPGSMLMLTQFLTGTAIDRTWVPLSSISRNLVRAVVVSEDGRFCEHSGIDTAAIKEAIERASRGTPRGASTISMQVTKNLFLWNAKSYVRKVIEIPLTLYMELIWPKSRILEVYLNIAEWGPGVFGAEAAARRHFGKSAARLSERESALLAAVLPNPVARNAGSPGQQTSAKARVVQARVKAYGSVASCVTSAAAAPAAAPAVVGPSRAIRKTPAKPAPRKKQQPVDNWAPTLNFGSP